MSEKFSFLRSYQEIVVSTAVNRFCAQAIKVLKLIFEYTLAEKVFRIAENKMPSTNVTK